jgi:hypothetical protein
LYFFTCEDKKFSITFPKSKTKTVIASFGDWNKDWAGNQTLGYLTQNWFKYDLILFLGDIAYDLDSHGGLAGDDFMQWMTPVSSRVPFMMATGNHENFTSFLHMVRRFRMPDKEKYNNLWYSFDVNDIHFVNIFSEISMDLEIEYLKPKFMNWLAEDLQKSTEKWKIAYFHRPIYCSYDINPLGCDEDGEKVANMFEQLLYENKVDLIMTGHEHYYERTFPVYKNKIDLISLSDFNNTYINPAAPVHVMCGTGGVSWKIDSIPSKIKNIIKLVLKSFSKYAQNKTGVCQIVIEGDMLSLQYIEAETGIIFDSFQINKINPSNAFHALTLESKFINIYIWNIFSIIFLYFAIIQV